MAKKKLLNRYRVLVCGDRKWTDREFLYNELDKLADAAYTIILIEGEATGADTMAREWAEHRMVPVEQYPAEWNNLKHPWAVIKRRRDGSQYNAAAGPIRNQLMITRGKPDLVMAFHNNIGRSKGTRDMVRRAKAHGIECRVLSNPKQLHALVRITDELLGKN